MAAAGTSLEFSDGTTVSNPTVAQISSALARIGAGLDHCILTLGGQTDFLQAAGSRGRLYFEYSDASGMHQTRRDDLDVETVARVFAAAMAGDQAWKRELEFESTGRPPGEGAAGEPGGPGIPGDRQQTGRARSLAEQLADTVRREAASGAQRLVRRGIGKLFRK